MKRCPRCKETKQDGEFYRNPKTGRLHSYCRPCNNEYASEERKRNRKAHNARVAKWRREHPEANRAIYQRWYDAHRQGYERERRKKVRKAVFTAYGGFICACCGETEPMFLTIDHIENDGASHRLELQNLIGKGGTAFFDWLYRNKFPSGFQVLCRNCNWGKHVNHGVCPHHDPEGSTTRAAARSSEAIAERSAGHLATEVVK